MATTSKLEKIFIGIDNNRIELTGAEKEAFLEQREKDNLIMQELLKEQQERKELKISAYKKLGLTDEEIATII